MVIEQIQENSDQEQLDALESVANKNAAQAGNEFDNSNKQDTDPEVIAMLNIMNGVERIINKGKKEKLTERENELLAKATKDLLYSDFFSGPKADNIYNDISIWDDYNKSLSLFESALTVLSNNNFPSYDFDPYINMHYIIADNITSKTTTITGAAITTANALLLPGNLANQELFNQKKESFNNRVKDILYNFLVKNGVTIK